jgi:hypothetical protein
LTWCDAISAIRATFAEVGARVNPGLSQLRRREVREHSIVVALEASDLRRDLGPTSWMALEELHVLWSFMLLGKTLRG